MHSTYYRFLTGLILLLSLYQTSQASDDFRFHAAINHGAFALRIHLHKKLDPRFTKKDFFEIFREMDLTNRISERLRPHKAFPLNFLVSNIVRVSKNTDDSAYDYQFQAYPFGMRWLYDKKLLVHCEEKKSSLNETDTWVQTCTLDLNPKINGLKNDARDYFTSSDPTTTTCKISTYPAHQELNCNIEFRGEVKSSNFKPLVSLTATQAALGFIENTLDTYFMYGVFAEKIPFDLTDKKSFTSTMNDAFNGPERDYAEPLEAAYKNSEKKEGVFNFSE